MALRGPTIGGVPLASPVVQAALSGYSDRAMRVLARRHGAAYALGEVLLDQFVATVGTNRRNLAAHEAPPATPPTINTRLAAIGSPLFHWSDIATFRV